MKSWISTTSQSLCPHIAHPQVRGLGNLEVSEATNGISVFKVKFRDQIYEFESEKAGTFCAKISSQNQQSDLSRLLTRVDLIADISGSMKQAFRYDIVNNLPQIPRIQTQELIYNGLRKLYPFGKNWVFNTVIKEYDLGTKMVPNGGTDLQMAIKKADPDAITVIITDDKDTINAVEILHERLINKMIIVVLLTSYSLELEYGEVTDKTSLGVKKQNQKRINDKYRIIDELNDSDNDPLSIPGYTTALLGQRDGPRDFIQVISAYNDKQEVSDQMEIISRISTAIEKTNNRRLWLIKNPYQSDFVIQCPSGATLNIPSKRGNYEGAVISVAPELSDLGVGVGVGIQSLIYIHQCPLSQTLKLDTK